MSDSLLIKLDKKSDKPQDELIQRAKEDVYEKHECLEIVKKIREFGVTQRQIIELINLLALELENREQMKSIRDACKEIKGDAIIIAKAE